MSEVLLQITSGRGPVECAWVVARLVDTILADVRLTGLEAEMIEKEDGSQKGTLLSALIHLAGERCEAFIAGYEGTVQWIGKSAFRHGHKRNNWFVGVRRLSIPKTESFHDRDVRIDTMRASGPGGQHVNTTDSSVRALHLPTGLVAIARDERSQMANRKMALERLAILVARDEQRKQNKARQTRWDAHNELVRGNPVRVYEGQAFKLVHN
ncbi:MAG: peptide chain release factor H [Deltaproteobacteria bacterium]|nr:peptide chain release factor H [Deltaproteobacteria bacterium]